MDLVYEGGYTKLGNKDRGYKMKELELEPVISFMQQYQNQWTSTRNEVWQKSKSMLNLLKKRK